MDFIHIFKRSSSPKKICFLLLHGTGGDEKDLIPIAEEIDNSVAILSPRGKVIENGMPRYFKRIAPGVFDLEDLKFRTKELYDFIIRAKVKYELEDHKMITLGYSNGANMAISLLFTFPNAFNAAILIRPMIPFEPKENINLKDKKILILAGMFDELVNKEYPKRLFNLLIEYKAIVEIEWIPYGHNLTFDDIKIIKNWYYKNF